MNSFLFLSTELAEKGPNTRYATKALIEHIPFSQQNQGTKSWLHQCSSSEGSSTHAFTHNFDRRQRSLPQTQHLLPHPTELTFTSVGVQEQMVPFLEGEDLTIHHNARFHFFGCCF